MDAAPVRPPRAWVPGTATGRVSVSTSPVYTKPPNALQQNDPDYRQIGDRVNVVYGGVG